MPVIDLIDDQTSKRIPYLRQVNDDTRVRIDTTTQGKGTDRTITSFQSKDEIRNNSDFSHCAPVRQLHAKREWASTGGSLIRHARNNFICMHKSHVVAVARGAIERNLKIDDFELVFDEWSSSLLVLAAPIDVRKIDSVTLNEKACTTIGERVHHRCGTRRRIVIELSMRTINVPCMEKSREPVIRAIERTADKRGNVRRSQEAISRKLAHDNNVVVGKPEGWRFGRATESRSTSWRSKCLRIHTDIITDDSRRQRCLMGKAPRMGWAGRDRSRLIGACPEQT